MNNCNKQTKPNISLASFGLQCLTCGGPGPGSRWVWPPGLHPHLLPAGSDSQRSGTEHGRASRATEMPHRCLCRAMSSEEKNEIVCLKGLKLKPERANSHKTKDF